MFPTQFPIKEISGYGGTLIMPLDMARHKNTVDAFLATAQIIDRTLENRDFFCTGLLIRCISKAGSITAAHVSIGTNSTSYNNIMADTTLTGVTAADKALSSQGTLVLLEAGQFIARDTDIFCKVNTAASVGTAQTLEVSLVGHYL